MTTPRPPTTFAAPATRFLASSRPEELPPGRWCAAAALFGVPLDLTESFRSGAHGGPAAIRAVSDSLETYSPALDRSLEEIACVDLGDVPLEGLGMNAALDVIADAMEHAASRARLAVMLGGEHTASLGGYRGLKRVHPDAALLHVDAHLDFREQYEGEQLTHASWLYHAGREYGFGNLYQLGLRSGDRAEWQAARERVALCSQDLALPTALRAALADRPIYLSVDIDVLDPAHAPGTGCPEPGGVTFRELLGFLHGLAGLRVAGMDVMEVSPNLDASGITATAAAKLVREAALLFG